MTEFRMPDSYYDPPEYDGCEDCPCEDPEHPEMRCPICHSACDSHETEPGEDCTQVEQVACTCECHNIPQDPNDDRPEPDWDEPRDYNDREREDH